AIRSFYARPLPVRLPQPDPRQPNRLARIADNLEHALLHFFNALRGVHVVQAPEPPVVRHQRLGQLLVSLEPRRYNFFPVVRPLYQLSTVIVAAAIHFWRALVNIINLVAHLTHAPAGDAFQHQRRIQRKMHHQRRPVTVLPQQDTQVLRLRDGPGKPVKHKAMRTIRSEEHTSELQSRFDLVCRLLLEKKKNNKNKNRKLYNKKKTQKNNNIN